MWIGAPPRLVVLSRYAAHSTVHLLDPYGPRTIAEIRLEAPMKLCASVGSHVLAVGALGAAVLTAGDTHLTPYQFPARTVPITAGAAGSQFVVALAGSIEEWDPQSRMPKRRLKLPRPAVITAVGGSDRVVWMTTQQDPTRLDVFALVNRGQPKSHELPEPIAHVSSHPRSDLVVCLGADSGRLYVVDLDGRAAMRTLGPEGLPGFGGGRPGETIDRVDAAGLVLGRMVGVLAAQARRPVIVVALEGSEVQAAAAAPVSREPANELPQKRSTLFGDEPIQEVPTAVTLQSPPIPEVGVNPPGPDPDPTTTPAAAPKPSLFRTPTPAAPPVAKSAAAKPTAAIVSLSERFSAWRDRMRSAQPRSSEPMPLGWIDARPSWRDEVSGWARGVAAGTVDKLPPPAPPIEALVARFDLSPQLYPAVALLYGAHLGGEPGAAPIDVARVLGRHWDEALGRGLLAERGLAVYRDSRVRLAPAVQRALDELPARTGTIVGEPGSISLLGPCVVIAPDGPIGIVAETFLPSAGGAILAAHPHADPLELVLEARAYGAAPMLRVSAGVIDRLPIGEPVILIVPDEATVEQLEIPRLV